MNCWHCSKGELCDEHFKKKLKILLYPWEEHKHIIELKKCKICGQTFYE